MAAGRRRLSDPFGRARRTLEDGVGRFELARSQGPGELARTAIIGLVRVERPRLVRCRPPRESLSNETTRALGREELLEDRGRLLGVVVPVTGQEEYPDLPVLEAGRLDRRRFKRP